MFFMYMVFFPPHLYLCFVWGIHRGLKKVLQELWDFSSSPEVANGWQKQPWDPEPSRPARAQWSFRNTTSPLVCISHFSNVQASRSDCGRCWQLYAQPEMCPKEGLGNSVTPGHLSPGELLPCAQKTVSYAILLPSSSWKICLSWLCRSWKVSQGSLK